MNSSTLRRLAADQSALRCAELPPHWLFAPSDSETPVPDDLTRLTVFLAGPQGTPYSSGLWKVSLKIPEDYPKSPPKAYFRTRIWHPNVEENTGSVCVDTLKRDWEPRLTLRDVLITITCLIINPNPDSALNSTAGHLLQEDYESFARQAKLMTSIHASVPSDLRDASLSAKMRGEDPGTTLPEDCLSRPFIKDKRTGLSSVIIKKLPQRIVSDQSVQNQHFKTQNADNSAIEEDGGSASKENDPALSPIPVIPPSPRRPTLIKRPLSDLPCPHGPTETENPECLSPSEQNVINNSSPELTRDPFYMGAQLAERNSLVNSSFRHYSDTTSNHQTISNPESTDTENGRPFKRICSDEAKENAQAGYAQVDGRSEQGKALKLNGVPGVVKATGLRKASAPSALGGIKAGKARVGLRRL